MRPERPWQRRSGCSTATGGDIHIYNFPPPSHPRPVSPAGTHRLPYRPSGASLPPLYPPNRIGKRKSKRKNTGTVRFRAGLARPPHYMLPGPPPRAITQFHLPLPTHPRPPWGQRGHPTDLCVPQGSFRLDKAQSLRVRRGVGSSSSPLHCSLSGGLLESCHP